MWFKGTFSYMAGGERTCLQVVVIPFFWQRRNWVRFIKVSSCSVVLNPKCYVDWDTWGQSLARTEEGDCTGSRVPQMWAGSPSSVLTGCVMVGSPLTTVSLARKQRKTNTILKSTKKGLDGGGDPSFLLFSSCFFRRKHVRTVRRQHTMLLTPKTW